MYVEAVLFGRAGVKNKMQLKMSHFDVHSCNIPRQCCSPQRSLWSTEGFLSLQATLFTQRIKKVLCRHKVESQEQFSRQTNKPSMLSLDV